MSRGVSWLTYVPTPLLLNWTTRNGFGELKVSTLDSQGGRDRWYIILRPLGFIVIKGEATI